MISLYDCALNGVSLSSLSERICILDIRESAPRLRQTSLALYPEGRQQYQLQRDSITLQIVFAVHEENPELRSLVFQHIRSWAASGGVLTVSDHPGLQLTVICTELPSVTSEDWTEKCVLSFQTTRCPYWEDAAETIVSGSGTMSVHLPGTASFAPVNALILNDGDAPITRITVQAADSRMTFEGIHLPAGRLMLLNQTDGPLKAWAAGQSVLHCRTADSDDQLLLPCGQESLVCTDADGTAFTTFTVRGRYV